VQVFSIVNSQSSILPREMFFLFYFTGASIQRGCEKMALMRAFAKVDGEGKIPIPTNIRREVNLKEDQLVEIKLSGPNCAQFITIHKRESAR